MKEQKPAVDWERIEIEYRAGTKSTREIASEHGVSHTIINRRAKAGEWARDLKAKIKAKADALVSRSEVSRQVSMETRITETLTVEVEATVQSRIRIGHRTDIARFRRLALALLAELEVETGDPALFEELGEMLRSEDDRGKDVRNDIYRKVISSAGRIDSMKKLAETLKTLIGLEREAFGIGEQEQAPGSSAADLFKALVEHLPD